jgi:hypothetical protein
MHLISSKLLLFLKIIRVSLRDHHPIYEYVSVNPPPPQHLVKLGIFIMESHSNQYVYLQVYLSIVAKQRFCKRLLQHTQQWNNC